MVGVPTRALPPASGVAGCDSLTGRAAPGSRSHFQRGSPSPSWSSCCRQCPGKAQCSFPLAHICCLCPQPSPSQCWLLLAAHGAEPRGLCASHVPLLCQGLPGSPAPQRHLGLKLNQQQVILQPCPLQLTLTGPTAGWGIILPTLCIKKPLKAISLVSESFPAKCCQLAGAGAGAWLWSCCCGWAALEGSRTGVAGLFAQGWQASAGLPGARRPCGRGMPLQRQERRCEQALCLSAAPSGAAALRSVLLLPAGRCPRTVVPLAGPGGQRSVPGTAGPGCGCRGAARARNPAAVCPVPAAPAALREPSPAPQQHTGCPQGGASRALGQRAPGPCPAAEKEPLREPSGTDSEKGLAHRHQTIAQPPST